MKKKNFILLIILTIGFSTSILSQTCQQCKKRVLLLYDSDVQASLKDSTSQSILDYWSLFFIAKGEKTYFVNQDATKDCFMFVDGAFFTKFDSVQQNSMKFGTGVANLPPSGEIKFAITDYILTGTVTGANGSYIATLNLETAKTREIVKTASSPYTLSNDPIEAGKALAAQLGPAYNTIIDFEKKKRDLGDPYALNPRIEITPDKTQLDFNQQTNLQILYVDCDDVPLTNRKIDLEVKGGTLDQTSIVTDDNGKATVSFTAGNVAGAAFISVSGTISFRHATGFDDAPDNQNASIMIKKPDIKWFKVAATKKYYYMSTVDNKTVINGGVSTEINHSESSEKQTFIYNGYITNLSLITDPNKFGADPSNVYLNYSGVGRTADQSFGKTVDCGLSEDQGNNDCESIAGNSSKPTFNFNIYQDSHNFSVSAGGTQTGGGVSQEDAVDCQGNENNQTTPSTCDPTYGFSLNLYDVNKDTTYNTTETSTPSGSNAVVVTKTTITQKFKWDKKVCTIDYYSTISETTTEHTVMNIPGDPPGSSQYDDYENTTQYFEEHFGMQSDGDVTDIKNNEVTNNFKLYQNNPNPFNGNTSIIYEIPENCKVNLDVYDLFGREIVKLVDETKAAGIYNIDFNSANLPEGIYIYTLNAGSSTLNKKMILIKK